MAVVVPLRVEIAGKMRCGIVVVFEHQMNLPVAARPFCALRLAISSSQSGSVMA